MKNARNIDGKNKTCYILDEYSPQETVPYEAAEYWYLNLYIITLDDVDGAFSSSNQKYLVLEYPSYTEVNSHNRINDCIWSVPYMAYVFKKPGIKRFSTVEAIKKFYEEQIHLHMPILDELENYRFYHMGISDYEKTTGSHYIEYKVSSRQPDKWKCYYIQEHYISKIDFQGLLNLADPESLHSYRYFPLVPQRLYNDSPLFFCGKRLASNVTHVIKNSYNKLLQYSNPVCGEMLRYELEGAVFKIDIIGFTKVYNKIVDEMRSLDENGKEIAVHFISGLSSIFESRLQEFGVSHFVIEGDGVTAALPIMCVDVNNGIRLILDCITYIKKDIDALLAKIGEKVSLRCSLATGKYFYGKLAGLSSNKQASGEIMILLSRMDQFLQECIPKLPDTAENALLLCLGNQIAEKNKRLLDEFGFVELTTQSNYRETKIDSTILYKED